MSYEGQTVFELGEQEALARATRFFKPAPSTIVGSGDDAAVVSVSDSRFVVTTDTMVENRDFRNEFSSGFDLGFKAASTNLADVVAMGAKPISLVVALLITQSTKVSWLEDFARGLQAAIDELAPSAEVVGGDLAAGEQIVISVTAHGDLEGRAPVLRSGAKPGDVIAVAGTLGKAACGLALLMHEDRTLAESYPELVEVQRRPRPVLATALKAVTANAMMDISDSLSLDAHRMAKASSVQFNLRKSDLLGYVAVLEQAAQSLSSRGSEIDPLDWVLFGGEDHGFLATFPKGQLPVGFRAIGEVVSGSGVMLDGQELEAKGWDSVSS